jgi:hypothetical protein
MVGDAIEMEIGPRVEDRAAHRDADGTAKIAHHLEQAASAPHFPDRMFPEQYATKRTLEK